MSTKKKTSEMTTTFEQLIKGIKETEAFDIEVVRDSISEQIYRIMDIEKISKADLARKLNTSPPYITKLLQGNGNFTIETLVRIARALGYRFRPMFIPTGQSWKPVAEYAESTNFKPSEQRITRASNFKASRKEIHIDLGNCGVNTETINDERLEPIAN